ncbi:MAG: hypothetical protein IPN77_10820 [Sandaracinaceae bacterium]|nr:hypothetical protein [Sandaracinaceae bacterium]
MAVGIHSLTAAALDGRPFFDDTVLGPVRRERAVVHRHRGALAADARPHPAPGGAQDAEPRPVLTHATAIYLCGQHRVLQLRDRPFSALSGFALLVGVTTGMLFFERQVLLIGLFFHVVGLAAIAYPATTGSCRSRRSSWRPPRRRGL